MKTICVIPAYNEAQNIGPVVKEVLGFVDEVIVVDDCSRDETSRMAEEAGALVTRFKINRGQGAALRLGTKLAIERDGEVIIHFDADGQFLATDLPKLIKSIESGEVDLCLGSRFLDRSTRMPKFKREVIMRLARFVNYLLGVRLTDPQSGLRAFNQASALKLQWSQDRMAHCSEILYEAHRLNLRIQEVPITVVYRHFGQKISGGFKIIIDLALAKLVN